MNPFIRRFQANATWHRVGVTSEFPELSEDQECPHIAPGCKAFSIPKSDSTSDSKAPSEADLDAPGDLKDQVLVFKYKGQYHAIDHVSGLISIL